MPMYLAKLELLDASMKAQGLRCTKFDFRFRALQFTVIYLNDCYPQELLFGARQQNIFFKVAVYDGYKIQGWIKDSAFFAIRDAVKANGNSHEKLLSKDVFAVFAEIIPTTTSGDRTPSYEEILSTSRDVEEESKIYFVSWIIHRNPQQRDVTKENLAKTLRACGSEFYQYCKQYRISSRWTDIETDRRPLLHPNSIN